MNNKEVINSALIFKKTGYLINAILLVALLLSNLIDANNQDDTQILIFVLGYTPLFFYFISLCIFALLKRKAITNELLPSYHLALAAFYISAYILNHSIPVFAEFVSWMYPFITICYLYLVLNTIDKFKPYINHPFTSFVLSLCIVLTLYQTVFVLQVFPIGLIGTILFGIGAHAAVPLLLLIAFIRQLIIHPYIHRYRVLSGIILLIGTTFAFTLSSYMNIAQKLDRQFETEVFHPNEDLPPWVQIGQNIPKNTVNQALIEGKLTYQTISFDIDNAFQSIGNFKKKINHPIYSILLFLTGDIRLSREDRIKILRSFFGDKAKTHRKLWSSQYLTTDKIIHQVELHPEYRLAFIQKDIYINSSSYGLEEALYSFDLPEGAIATSLSLWVNGVEEQSRLTTKCKADEAYRKIVGIERRDPALMHWQEGNQVTVTVFPITRNNPRHLRVGFTLPLQVVGDQLAYYDVGLQGPDREHCQQIWRVIHPTHPYLKHGFKQVKGLTTEYRTTSDKAPPIIIDKPALSPSPYVYDGFQYHMEAYSPALAPKEFDDIYLDINESWQLEEIEAIVATAKNRKIFISTYNKLISLDPINWQQQVAPLFNNSANLFPYYKVSQPDKSILITKSIANSPSIRELENCNYVKSIKESISKQGEKLAVYDLATQPGLFVKLMSQTQNIVLCNGDLKTLTTFLADETFPTPVAQGAVLPAAQVVIHKTPVHDRTLPHTGTDHLMRLHQYQQVVSGIGHRIFDSELCDIPNLQAMAETAHILTPISSMIVLESKADYDRFDIKKNHGLQNAQLKSAGAVPEPEEWALIIIAILGCTYLYMQKRIAHV